MAQLHATHQDLVDAGTVAHSGRVTEVLKDGLVPCIFDHEPFLELVEVGIGQGPTEPDFDFGADERAKLGDRHADAEGILVRSFSQDSMSPTR